jgi:hypothetical protein
MLQLLLDMLFILFSLLGMLCWFAITCDIVLYANTVGVFFCHLYYRSYLLVTPLCMCTLQLTCLFMVYGKVIFLFVAFLVYLNLVIISW